jgi:hypothetical protein
MNGWRGLIFVLFISIAGMAYSATGKAPADFRGIKWGGAPTGAIQSVGVPSGEDKLETWKNTKRPASFLGVAVEEEEYSFAKGKLYGGMLFFKTKEHFLILKEKLMKLYGNPDFADDSVPIYKWKWKPEEINMYIVYQGESQRTTISFTTDKIQ